MLSICSHRRIALPDLQRELSLDAYSEDRWSKEHGHLATRVSSLVTDLMLAALMELGAERNEEERDSSRCALAEGGREGLEAMGKAEH